MGLDVVFYAARQHKNGTWGWQDHAVGLFFTADPERLISIQGEIMKQHHRRSWPDNLSQSQRRDLICTRTVT